MDYRPSGNRKSKEILEQIFEIMDQEEKKRKTKPKKVKGLRAEFLEKYKVEDYESAKKAINAKFGRVVFDDSVLKKWIEEEETQK